MCQTPHRDFASPKATEEISSVLAFTRNAAFQWEFFLELLPQLSEEFLNRVCLDQNYLLLLDIFISISLPTKIVGKARA